MKRKGLALLVLDPKRNAIAWAVLEGARLQACRKNHIAIGFNR
jgi:hypothetical protein